MKLQATVDEKRREITVHKPSGAKLMTIYCMKSDGDIHEPLQVFAQDDKSRLHLIWDRDWELGCWELDDMCYEERIEWAINKIYPHRFKNLEVHFL